MSTKAAGRTVCGKGKGNTGTITEIIIEDRGSGIKKKEEELSEWKLAMCTMVSGETAKNMEAEGTPLPTAIFTKDNSSRETGSGSESTPGPTAVSTRESGKEIK